MFKLNASGQATVLYSFIGGVDGLDPEAGLFMALRELFTEPHSMLVPVVGERCSSWI